MDSLKHEPGWFGFFSRDQAEGAIPNGTVIEKWDSEEGDTNPDGTQGVILGSLLAPPMVVKAGKVAKCLYFVEWVTRPKVAVGIADFKVRPCQTH